MFWIPLVCVACAVYVTVTELRREAPAALIGLWAAACLVFPVVGFLAWLYFRREA
ncbi:PLDc N-terminal domain-containing protein [Corynebacterium gerontici]|uniref:PLDc N-terminal domain-containing protein n=1 Tax=Corynebacterium gerontici TaxID=2079234 RepID=UPI00360F6E4C